jgi:site-specific DNA-cytosine methylase
MNVKQQYVFGRKKIVVVSLFSGMDLFLFGMVSNGMTPGYAVERNIYPALMHAANFKNSDGSSVIEFLNISEEEYIHRKSFKDNKGRKSLEDTCIKTEGGQYVRTKEISEVSGHEIRESIEKRFGKDVFIIVIGGPVCYDLTKLNTKRILGEGSRNLLMYEYVRILKELNELGRFASIAIMEQVSDLGSPKFKEVYDGVVSSMLELPFRIAEADLCSLHFFGNQNRLRKYFFSIHEFLNIDPFFQEPDLVNVKRVRDFLPHIDYFRPGQFSKGIKSKNDFMCTVTSGTPEAFYKDGVEFTPSFDDLLLCFDVEKGMYKIPAGIPPHQLRKAIQNNY